MLGAEAVPSLVTDEGRFYRSPEELFATDPDREEVLAEVRDLDPAAITPADLLAKVERWQSELDGRS